MERRFGRYTVLATLGTGAMGEVFRARDERLGREVAIKTLRNVAGLSRDAFRARFEAEARALAALSHPAIVHVHDLGIEGEEPYLVLELVDGPSLKAILAAGPMPPGEVRAMGIQVARALEAAHRARILHRDLKPANILRTADGQWKLADFGIARVPDSDLTLTGQFLGTPAYAAPESLGLGQFSEQSDVFGLAATMVEALTGERLRGAATLTELVGRRGEAITLPAAVPPDLAGVLRAALSTDPAERPTAARLAELLAGRTPAPRRSRTIAVIAVTGAVAVAGVLAAVFATGKGGAAPPDPAAAAVAATEADAAADADAAVEVAEPARELPPIVPGRITVVYPADVDRDAYQAYARVVDEVRRQRFDQALRRLDEYEGEFGATVESQHLRAQIEALPGFAE